MKHFEDTIDNCSYMYTQNLSSCKIKALILYMKKYAILIG